MHVTHADHDAALAFLKHPGVIPARVPMGRDEPTVMLVDVGSEPLQGAFLDECVARNLAASGGFARRVRAPLSILEAAPAFDNPVPLAGILFHVSRCGSSIPVRICQADPTTTVIPEAEPLDVVVTRMPLSHEARVRALRAVVAMYARDRTGSTERLVLKLDAWHLASHALFREAFPHVPFAVVVRDPLDVAVSHAVNRGSHMVPGLLPRAVLGIDASEFQPHELDRYGCLALPAAVRYRAGGVQPCVVRRDVGQVLAGSLRSTPSGWNSPSAPARCPLVDAIARPAYEALAGT
ncbi:MAG: hypothetical protein IPN77_03095 [Sandaracinaceae bacterium]|nr:hypothetical protein [Sandaracinaceae bacterium]